MGAQEHVTLHFNLTSLHSLDKDKGNICSTGYWKDCLWWFSTTWPSHSKTSLKVNLYQGYYYLRFVSSTKKILWAEKNQIEGYPIIWLIPTHTGSCIIMSVGAVWLNVIWVGIQTDTFCTAYWDFLRLPV